MVKPKTPTLHLFDDDHNQAVEEMVAAAGRRRGPRPAPEGKTLHLVANGLGAPSMLMAWCGLTGIIPMDYSCTADTGSERDRLISTGERMSAPAFFEKYVITLFREFGAEAVLVRTGDIAVANLARFAAREVSRNYLRAKRVRRGKIKCFRLYQRVASAFRRPKDTRGD